MVWTVVAVGIFLVAMVLVGYYAKKLVKSSQDFMLAGRNLSVGINMMGVIASGFAGTTIALSPMFNIQYGVFGSFMFALGYGVVGVMFYGLFFAKTIRRSGAHTLPEWLEIRYNKNVRRILSILGLIGMIGVVANNVLALANVLTGFFGISLYLSIAIGVLTFLLFTYFSGMWGVSLTDFAQALIGLVGAPLLIIVLVTQFGGFGDVASNWPQGSWLTNGISGESLPNTLAYPSYLTMILNLGIFLVWGGQHYWQRMASARNEKQAQMSYAIAGVFLFFITMLIGFVGSYAGAFFGSEFTPMGGALPPSASYGFMVAQFPPAASGFLLIFALAASLSTAATTLLAAVSMSVRDVYKQYINKESTDQQTMRAGRIATIIISLVAWGLAYYPGGTAFLFAFATAWWAPAGILFALGLVSNRITNKAAMTATVVGTVCLSLWAILDLFKIPVYRGQPIGNFFHMSVLGLVVVGILAIVVSWFTKPKYYADPLWKAGKKFTTVKLDDEDKQVLQLIQRGYRTNAEIMDITGWLGEKLKTKIEKLDEANYIKRDALRGAGFWAYQLTEKGRNAMPAPTTEEAAVLKFGLTPRDIQNLRSLQGVGKQNIVTHITSLTSDVEEGKEIMASFVKMFNEGYVKESGFLQRYFEITDKGEEILKKVGESSFANHPATI